VIGQWVARFRESGEKLTRDHYVESVIAGREVTRCGRQLADRDGTVVTVTTGDERCRQCG
jgi:hypothetical protein